MLFILVLRHFILQSGMFTHKTKNKAIKRKYLNYFSWNDDSFIIFNFSAKVSFVRAHAYILYLVIII